MEGKILAPVSPFELLNEILTDHTRKSKLTQVLT